MTYFTENFKTILIHFLIINQQNHSLFARYSNLNRKTNIQFFQKKILLKYLCKIPLQHEIGNDTSYFFIFPFKFEEETVFLSRCIQDLIGSVYGDLVGLYVKLGNKKRFPDKSPEEKVAVPGCSKLKLK